MKKYLELAYRAKESSVVKRVIQELTKPKKPMWVGYILALINSLAVMLVGWDKFFSVFDDSASFLLACEIAAFAIVTLLVYKDKDNKTAMNWASSAVIVVVTAGFFFNHSGFRDWLAKESPRVTVAQPAVAQKDEIEKVFNLSAGECVEYVFRFPGGRYSSWPEGSVLVKRTTANDGTRRYIDGPGVLTVIPNAEPSKIEYCSIREPVRIVLKEWRV